MVFTRSYILPIIVGIWFPLTFVITYITAVLNKNVYPVFPYISDTGTWSPDSCIFGLLLTVGAILMFIVVYIRYRQVRDLCEKNDFKPRTRKLNTVSFYLGFLATTGIILVGNFQETNVLVVHIIGAVLCFGVGAIYQLLQVIISFSIYPTMGKNSVNILRALCTAICFITLNLTGAFCVVSLYDFKGDDITKWGKEDGGYDSHLVSSIAEWVLAITSQLFLVSYTKEFKLIEFTEPAISARKERK